MITKDAARIIGCPEDRILSTVDRTISGIRQQRRCTVHSMDFDGSAVMTQLVRFGKGPWVVGRRIEKKLEANFRSDRIGNRRQGVVHYSKS